MFIYHILYTMYHILYSLYRILYAILGSLRLCGLGSLLLGVAAVPESEAVLAWPGSARTSGRLDSSPAGPYRMIDKHESRFIYIYICIWTCVYMYIYIYVYTYIHTEVCIYIGIFTHVL